MIIVFIILTINFINIIFNLFAALDLDFSCFDFINEPQNPNSGNSGNSGEGGNSSGGGDPGHEQNVHRPESDRSENKDKQDRASAWRAKHLEKPSDDIEINTVEGAITHIEKLKQREHNLRIVVAKHHNISRDFRLRDLDISFKKPHTPIAKYLDYCRKMDDPRHRIFYKGSPGNTPVANVLNYLRNKLTVIWINSEKISAIK